MSNGRSGDRSEHNGNGIVDFVNWLCDSSDVELVEGDDSASLGGSSRPTDHASRNDDDDPVELPTSFGRYRAVELLGRGATAYVYRGIDDQLHREVAIKAPRRATQGWSEAQRHFLAEARRAAKLDHPGVVKVLDCGETDDGQPFVVSDLVHGTTLAEVIAARQAFSWREGASLVADIAHALQHVHERGFVHRDVKPQNILLDEQHRPMLTDLGIALADDEANTGLALAGTKSYLSPEQARFRSGAVDGRADIFSLGTVFYQLLTGKLPFAAKEMPQLLDQICNVAPKPPRQLDQRIPPRVERICLKCLEKSPSDRYSSAGDVARELRGAVSEDRRRRYWAIGFGLVSAAVLLFAALAWKRSANAPMKLTRFEVTHFDRSGEQPRNVGLVDGIDAKSVRFGDSVRVQAEFDRPAYVALLTLDADGGVKLRAPRGDGSVNATRKFTYPAGSVVYTLNDAEGLQGLLLLASADKLAGSADWEQEVAKRWQAVSAAGVWKYDGHNFELHGSGDRGSEESIATLPEPFSDVCQWSRTIPKVDVIQGLAFPVIKPE